MSHFIYGFQHILLNSTAWCEGWLPATQYCLIESIIKPSAEYKNESSVMVFQRRTWTQADMLVYGLEVLQPAQHRLRRTELCCQGRIKTQTNQLQKPMGDRRGVVYSRHISLTFCLKFHLICQALLVVTLSKMQFAVSQWEHGRGQWEGTGIHWRNMLSWFVVKPDFSSLLGSEIHRAGPCSSEPHIVPQCLTVGLLIRGTQQMSVE